MSDYFDRLEFELRAAVARSSAADQRGARARLRWRMAAGRAASLAGVAVTLGVAALAIVLLSRERQPVVAQRGPRPTPTLRQLRAEFGVLRRPQTTADRSWQPAQLPGGARQITGLTRLARTLPGGDRLFLTVGRVPAYGTYQLLLWKVRRDGKINTRAYPRLREPWPLQLGPELFATVAPDGVRTAFWTFAPVGHPGATPVSTSVPVIANVGVVALPRSGYAPIALVWHAAGGRVVGEIISSTGGTRVRKVLAGNGIRRARFGESTAAATARVEQLLGAPSRAVAVRGACNYDFAVQWPDLQMYFRHGHFVGFSYGPRPEIGGRPILKTARGLGIRDSLAQGRRLYGSAFQASAAQGGSWSVATPSGQLKGFADRVPSSTNVHVARVRTIEAGAVGCPALSP